jgi:hypothetical protein
MIFTLSTCFFVFAAQPQETTFDKFMRIIGAPKKATSPAPQTPQVAAKPEVIPMVTMGDILRGPQAPEAVPMVTIKDILKTQQMAVPQEPTKLPLTSATGILKIKPPTLTKPIAPTWGYDMSALYSTYIQPTLPYMPYAVGLGGLALAAYMYHQRYVKPTPAIIDESIRFIEALRQDPFAPIRNRGSLGLEAFFEKNLPAQEGKILRALGLAESALNIKSYLQPIGEEREKINQLFSTLHSNYRELPADVRSIPRSGANEVTQLTTRIQPLTSEIYLELLKAKNIYNTNTFKNVINKICRDRTYTIPRELLESSEYEAYNQIRTFITDQNSYKAPAGESAEFANMKLAEFTQWQNNILSQLKLSKSILHNIPGFRLTRQQLGERRNIENLFNRLKEAYQTIDPARFNQLSQGIIELASTCCASLISHLDERQQWEIVSNYLTTTGKNLS